MSVYYIGDLEFYSDPTEIIEHHGILGQKWYVRRFQNKDGSYTPEGRERYGIGQPREWDGTDEDKQRILKSGSAAEVMSLQGKVSNQELQQAAQRLQLESNIRNIANSDAQRAQQAQPEKKDLMATLGKAAALLGTAITLYQKVDTIRSFVQKAQDKKRVTPAMSYARSILDKYDKEWDEHAKNGDGGWFPDAKDMATIVSQLSNYKKIMDTAEGKSGGGKG